MTRALRTVLLCLLTGACVGTERDSSLDELVAKIRQQTAALAREHQAKLAEEERRRKAQAAFWDVQQDWMDRTHLHENVKRLERFHEKYVLLADLAAAGVESDQRELLKVQLRRLFKERLDRRPEELIATVVSTGLMKMQVGIYKKHQRERKFLRPSYPCADEVKALVARLKVEAEEHRAPVGAKQAELEWFDGQLEDPPGWEEFQKRLGVFSRALRKRDVK